MTRALPCLLLACACTSSRDVTVTAPFDLEGLRTTGAVTAIHREHARRWTLRARGEVRLEHPAACTRVAAAGETDAPLSPLVDLGPDRPAVGFDMDYTIEARPGCPEASAGTVTWRDADLAVEPRGFRARGRTPTLAAALGDVPLAPGVVPLSPRTRGERTLEATWRGPGRPDVALHVRIAAMPRATGIPTLATSQAVLLGGTGWRVEKAAAGTTPALEPAGAVTRFVATRTDRFTLTDGAGHTLQLGVAPHDDVRLDCGRNECHPRLEELAAHTPMGTVLERHLVRGDARPVCGMSCHAAGEPGLADGGFSDVAAQLGWAHGGAGFAELPRPLRRLGNVGCTACHGPSSIPLPAARWTVLRVDVCAVCHDAPPRYGHVAAWRTSRMARADASPATRTGACARCHTTTGHLHAIGARTTRDDDPPAGTPPIGIACAACHAPHGEPVGPRLVRRLPAPAILGEAGKRIAEGPSSPCLGCHSPTAADAPESSAAAIWLGQGGVRVDTGESLVGPAPHADTARGCLGCHDAGPAGLDRGAGHAFAARREPCTPCHTAATPRDGTIAARARALAARLRVPGHATTATPPKDPRAQRAARNVRLVLEDPAAWAHNPAYARALLDEADPLREVRHGAPETTK